MNHSSSARPSRKDMPLKLYSGLVILFNTLLGCLISKHDKHRTEENGPLQISFQDMVLLGVATHKLSRIVTKSLVGTPFRAPFTDFNDFLGYGEVQEEAKDRGIQLALGEIMSCNYCADPWIALGFLYSLRSYPEKTKLLFKFFSSVAIADFLHVAYEANRTRANVLTLREEKLERQEKKSA
jgi:hypothetical protein